MSNLLLNARFVSRTPTGVDRVATELASALLQMELPAGLGRLSGTCPQGGIVASDERPPALLNVIETSASRLTGQLWEQVHLARYRPDDWLLSLCNMGPVFRRRQVVMIHDAQVFRQPDSYSRAFRTWYNVAQPALGHRAACVLTVSHHSKAEIEAFKIAPVGKTHVVHNGADHILRVKPDTGTLQKHGLSAGKFFLAIGSLAPHKNLVRLIEAAAMRQDRSIPLVIAGGGNAAVFSAHGLKPSQDVRMLGRVSDGELRALYEQAFALVFPSITEGFGLPPAEAMFCGCPVIASTGGAVPEVCADAGLAVDPFDVQGWAAAMDSLARDPDLRNRLIARGHAQIAPFTWRAAAASLISHLGDVQHRL